MMEQTYDIYVIQNKEGKLMACGMTKQEAWKQITGDSLHKYFDAKVHGWTDKCISILLRVDNDN